MEKKFHFLLAFLRLIRPRRTLIVAITTGAAAHAAGADLPTSLWMILAGWCLSVGGFSLDLYADRDLDIKGVKLKTRLNPIADGSITPEIGLVTSITFIFISFFVMLHVAPTVLLLWSIILIVIAGLAFHVFDGPLYLAFTMGLLQASYFLMGGAAGSLSSGLLLLAATLFFAMFGGRGMMDIRDFPQDEGSKVDTLPKRYGIKKTVIFSIIFLHISYILSLAAYFTGEFNIVYLYIDLTLIFVGLICAWFFAVNPSPNRAEKLTPVFSIGEAALFCLAIVLGSNH
jgi:4-hydroxybenzoate polyprenyltransferase